MKKIVLATLLATGLMAAESGFYIGLDAGQANNTDKSTTQGTTFKYKNNYSDVKFKLGIEDEGTKFQVTFAKIDYQNGVFYASEGNILYEVGIDVIKEFEVTPSVYPFLKLGVGYGKMDTKRAAYGTINEISSNIGVGLSYKIVDHLYALAGVDYVYRHWNDTSADSFTYVTRDSAIKPYVGVNYKF
jgi:Outer membrane protein beta-barrel domain